jgi:hypothetical protein
MKGYSSDIKMLVTTLPKAQPSQNPQPFSTCAMQDAINGNRISLLAHAAFF